MKAITKNDSVETHGKKLNTTCLMIAELFGNLGHNLLKSLETLVSKIQLGCRDYIDSSSKHQKIYVQDNRSLLITMPLIGSSLTLVGGAL